MSAEDRVKGAAIREMILWLRKRLGPERVHAALEAIPPDFLAQLDVHHDALGLLPGNWYPSATTRAFIEELTRGMSRSDARQLAYEGSQASLTVTLTGVHRAVLRAVGSPELHARLAQRLWDTYFTTGRVRVERVGPTEVHIIYTEWGGHYRFACDMCTASDLVIYGAMGLRGVQVSQVRCVSDGDADCTHSVSWVG